MAPRNTRVAPETQVRSPARSFLQSLDNFYAPARDRRGEEALQRGISAFSGIFEEKAAQAKQEQRQNEYQQGVMDAMREEAGQELKGVQTGSLFRQHSKFYLAGLNETRGKAAASKFKADFARAYQEWEGKHTDVDGSGFRAFMNEQIGVFMQSLGDDQYMAAGALPILNEVATNYATQHTAFVNQRLEEESWEAYDEIIAGAYDGYANGDYDMDGLVDRLQAEADDMYLTEGGAANDRMVDAAIRYANIHNDPDALLALAKAHDAGKIKLSVVNREKLANAMDAVEADLQREISRQNAQDEAEAKASRRQLLDAWGKQLQDDPYAPMPSWQEVGDYTTYTQMQTLAETFQKASTNENPQITSAKRMGFEAELFAATTVAEKIKVLAAFTQSNPGALSGADVSKYTKGILESGNPGSLINDPTVTKYRDGFGQKLGALQTDDYNLDTVSILRTQGMIHYNDYMLANAGKVDVTDPAALRQVIKEAEEYAMEQLAFEFPDILAERAADKPAEAASLGVGDALQNRQAIIDEQAAAEFVDMAGVESPAGQTEGEPEVTEPGTEATPEGDLPLEEQPAPFEDYKSEEAYTPNRNGFYGELIKRFTDGEDTRHTYQSAKQVLDGDEPFRASVEKLAAKYSIQPMALMAVMDFETGGTFASDVRNAAGSGATGLIQFMPSTAKALGTTTDALARMTRSEQMVYVEKYFDQFAGAIRGGQVDDVYMAVLYPKAIGKPDGYVLFQQGTTAYAQNAGLDTNRDGRVTKFEAAAKVKAKFYGL